MRDLRLDGDDYVGVWDVGVMASGEVQDFEGDWWSTYASKDSATTFRVKSHSKFTNLDSYRSGSSTYVKGKLVTNKNGEYKALSPVVVKIYFTPTSTGRTVYKGSDTTATSGGFVRSFAETRSGKWTVKYEGSDRRASAFARAY